MEIITVVDNADSFDVTMSLNMSSCVEVGTPESKHTEVIVLDYYIV